MPTDHQLPQIRSQYCLAEFRRLDGKTYRVEHPRAMLEAIFKTSLEEMLRIGDSVITVYSERNRRKRTEGSVPDLSTILKMLKILWQNVPEAFPPQEPEKQGTTSRSFRVPVAGRREEALWLLQYTRDLKGITTRRLLTGAVLDAIADDDVPFFISLGRRMDEPLEGFRWSFRPLQKLTPLRAALLAHWIPDAEIRCDSCPSFCFFTDQAITDSCNITRIDSSISLDAVRLARRQLGLIQAKRKLVRRVDSEDGKVRLG